MKIIRTISLLVSLTLSSLIIYYVTNLEKIGCECSMGYKRTYILAFSGFSIAYSLFATIYGVDKLMVLYMKNPLLYAFPAIIAIGAIVNIVFTLMFIEEMKKKNCKCSESVYRDMMYVLAILQASSYALAIFLGGYAGYMYSRIKVPELSEKQMKEINSLLKNLPKKSK